MGLTMNKFLTTLLVFSFCLAVGMAPKPALGAEEGFSSLEEQMTGQEFEATGLEKLSPQELEALNGWIRRHSLATLDASSAKEVAANGAEPQVADQRGLKGKKEEKDRTPITSRIVGRFSGWDGQTVFKLENGMIWAQADKDKFFTKEVENPVVVIEPGMFGTWRLSIEGFNSNCRVERIQ